MAEVTPKAAVPAKLQPSVEYDQCANIWEKL